LQIQRLFNAAQTRQNTSPEVAIRMHTYHAAILHNISLDQQNTRYARGLVGYLLKGVRWRMGITQGVSSRYATQRSDTTDPSRLQERRRSLYLCRTKAARARYYVDGFAQWYVSQQPL
jgi:hypothetical protein